MTPLSLRPYNGNLYLAKSVKDYQRSHKKLFKHPDILNCGQGGRFSAGCGKDNMWTYLIYAREPYYLVHELSHVVLHVFKRCGIHPWKAGGEPFCYMLSQLVLEASGRK